MSDELSAEHKKQIAELVSKLCLRLSAGETPKQLIADLESTGISNESATEVVHAAQKLLYESKRIKERRKGLERMVVGGLAFLIGGGVSLWSYMSAASSPFGGRYVVFYGAVIYGIITFFRGISAYFDSK